MSISDSYRHSEGQIIPSLLRAVISPVKSATYSDFENESNITNIYRRICEINEHARYFP